MNTIYLTNYLVNQEAKRIAEQLKEIFGSRAIRVCPLNPTSIPFAYILSRYFFTNNYDIVDKVLTANVTIDITKPNLNIYPADTTIIIKPFNKPELNKSQIIFPWETETVPQPIEDHITKIIEYVGDNPLRGVLIETPKRVALAWSEWCAGYKLDPKEILKVFDDGGEQYDQMIVVKDIPFYSHCEHHLAPFFGTATVAYIPDNGRIVGLSKLARLVECFAKRLQVQERLTNQIADALFDNLAPLGVGVTIQARHLCMESRGICKQGHSTETTAIKGKIRTDASTKAEFLRAIGK